MLLLIYLLAKISSSWVVLLRLMANLLILLSISTYYCLESVLLLQIALKVGNGRTLSSSLSEVFYGLQLQWLAHQQNPLTTTLPGFFVVLLLLLLFLSLTQVLLVLMNDGFVNSHRGERINKERLKPNNMKLHFLQTRVS